MSRSSWDEDTIKDVSYYTDLVAKHGISHRALDWGSIASQKLRFEVLAGMGNLAGASILDVGCGTGDFWGWLNEAGLLCKYAGVDVTPAMIELARLRFPDLQFDTGSISQYPGEAFDYVFASGIFAKRTREPFEFMCEHIVAMFERCRKGLAFNSLSTWGGHAEDGEFNADPEKAMEFCRTITPRLVLRHDYLPHDFTIYMYKSPVA
jgi:SAM-dependent methyltransferase